MRWQDTRTLVPVGTSQAGTVYQSRPHRRIDLVLPGL